MLKGSHIRYLYRFLAICFLLVALGCAQDDKAAPKDSGLQDPIELPAGAIPLRWFYSDHGATPSIEPSLKRCADNFTLGGTCLVQGEQCKLGDNIYSCWPFDKMVRMSGKVLDLAGKPIAGARVTAGYSYSGYTDLAVTYSANDGSFTIKSNSCLPVIYAQRDGFIEPRTNYYLFSVVSGCVQENYRGVKGLKVVLASAKRSIPPSEELTHEPGLCKILGRVVDETGAPLKRVRVRTSQDRFGVTYTNDEGYYKFMEDDPCPETCVATKLGYSHPEFGKYVYASCHLGRPADLILTKDKK